MKNLNECAVHKCIVSSCATKAKTFLSSRTRGYDGPKVANCTPFECVFVTRLTLNSMPFQICKSFSMWISKFMSVSHSMRNGGDGVTFGFIRNNSYEYELSGRNRFVHCQLPGTGCARVIFMLFAAIVKGVGVENSQRTRLNADNVCETIRTVSAYVKGISPNPTISGETMVRWTAGNLAGIFFFLFHCFSNNL